MKSSRRVEAVGTAPSHEESMAGERAVRYCAVCGGDSAMHGTPIERFGETLCSEAHAEVFVAEVRTERARAATLPDPAPRADGSQGAHCAMSASGGPGWKQWRMRALCWGGPALAVVLLLGGGSSLLGAAGAALPYLALLACPLGMIIMMKSMGGMQRPPTQQQPRVVNPEQRTPPITAARQADAEPGRNAP